MKSFRIVERWQNPVSNWWSFYAGVVLFAGTTLLYPLADVGLIVLVLWGGFRTKWEVVVLGLIVTVSSLWSSDPISPVWFLVRVVFLWSVFQRVEFNRYLWLGIGSIALVTFGVSLYQMVSGTAIFENRPHGINMNSSTLGLSGLVLAMTPLSWLGAVTLGISAARTFCISLFIWAVFVRRDWSALMVGAVALVSLMWAMEFQGNKVRITSERIASDWELRESILIPEPISDPEKKQWNWYGYGYRSFVLDTEQQRPHNVWVLSWYELGYLTVVFWGLIGYGLIRYRLWWMLPFLMAGYFTDELFARPEGLYALTIGCVGWVWTLARRRQRAYNEPIGGQQARKELLT